MIYTCTYNPAIDYKLELDNCIKGATNRTTFNKFVAGGKGINVSVVLKRLNVSNIAIGFLGGFTGRFVNDFVTSEFGLNTNFIEVNDLTRINVKLKENEVETEVNAIGPDVTVEEMNSLLNLVESFDNKDIICIGGSPAKGEAANYKSLLEVCKRNDIDFVLDASKSYLLDGLQYRPLLVKPNKSELEELFNCEINDLEDCKKYGSKLLDLGAKNVIVSLGKDGSIFLDNSNSLRALPIIGDVKNTVGAGDSMVAGFIKGIVQGLSKEESFKYAVACGTATAFNFDLANSKDVEYYINKVVVEVL